MARTVDVFQLAHFYGQKYQYIGYCFVEFCQYENEMLLSFSH